MAMDRLMKIVLLSLACFAVAQSSHSEDEFYDDYKKAIEILHKIPEGSYDNFGSCDLFEQHGDLYIEALQHSMMPSSQHGQAATDQVGTKPKNNGIVFSCNLFGHTAAALNVNQLTPYDISVVGAMGDSITAAFGANARSIVQLIEYRGVSWSIGGDDGLEEVVTLPNIIKKYNPNVKGFSLYEGDVDSPFSNLNVAVSGSIAQDMPDQAHELVSRISNDNDIDIDNDWKVVTLFIGGNNLCKYCKDEEFHSVANYYNNVKEALDILSAQLPRTFVNLVLIFDVAAVEPLKKNDFLCCLVHFIACPCAGDEETSAASIRYQKALEGLIASGRYEKDDFTVVIQPLLIEMEVPVKDDGSNEADRSYFAPDCFHFSGKGHKEAAVALWNNMMQPIGAKQRQWEINGDIICPTQDTPYFYTKRNSVGVVPPLPGNQ